MSIKTLQNSMRTYLASAFLLFVVPACINAQPIIDDTNVGEAPRSGRVVIYGQGFGMNGEVLIAGLDCWVTTWTDARVVAHVPETADLGVTDLRLIVGGQQSNAVPLTVTERQSEGRVLWTFEADADNLWWRPALSPDGTIYIHTNNDRDGLVYALSPDGGLLWVQKVNWYPYVPPSAGPDGAVYVGSIGTIYRISPFGEIDWLYNDPDGINIEVSPTIGPDGMLYGAFEISGAFAMNPLTAEVLWSNPGDPVMSDKSGHATEMKFGPSVPGGPVDQLYVSMDRIPLIAFSLDGDQRFTASLSNLSGTAEVAIGSDGTIYGPRSIGLQVAAVDPADGSTIWEYFGGWATGIENVEIGPDDMLYFVGGAGQLEAFDPYSQRQRWQRLISGFVQVPSISPNGSTLVVSGMIPGSEGFVKAFNPKNGKELWTVTLPSAPYPGFRVSPVHHARITADSSTAYVSTWTAEDLPSVTDKGAFLFAIDLVSEGGGGKKGKGGGKGGGKNGRAP